MWPFDWIWECFRAAIISVEKVSHTFAALVVGCRSVLITLIYSGELMELNIANVIQRFDWSIL